MENSSNSTKYLNLNVINEKNDSTNVTPVEYDNMSIKKNWKEAGGKPNHLIIITYNNYKLCKCSNGYVRLCIHDGCENLALIRDNNSKCKLHSQDKESYIRCRHNGCSKRSTFGHE